MQTVRNTAGMIYSRVTTISNGEMLISDGMFRLEAYDNSNKPLQLKSGVSLSANLLADDYNAASKVFIGINTSDPDNKVKWELWPDSTLLIQAQIGTTIYGINKLFTWCNLDRFMNETPLTNITVTIPSGFSNVNSTCFFKYTDENAGSYLPSNVTLEAFSTQASHYKVVQGRQAKVFIISNKDGKWYYQMASTGAITADQTLNITTLIETSEENLEAAIASF